MTKLVRYWFRLEPFGFPSPLNIGCGITAYSIEDAKSILSDRVLKSDASLKIAGVIVNVDVSNIDNKHVSANMGTPHCRGVWFPLGYDY
jgi:hypothetical protein